MSDDAGKKWLDLLEEDDIPVAGAAGSDVVVGKNAPASAPSSVPASVPTPAVSAAEPAVAAVPTIETPTEQRSADDADIVKIKSVLEKRAADAAPPENLPVVPDDAANFAAIVAKPPLDEAIDDAVAASGVVLKDADMEKRFRMLVQLYFRDLRDRLETTSKLTMPPGSGGIGLTDAEAQRTMAVLMQKNTAYHSESVAQVKEGKEQYVAARIAKTASDAEMAIQKETSSLDRAFEKATGKALPATPVAPAPPRTIPVTAAGKSDASVVVRPMSPSVAVSNPAASSAPAPVPPPAPMARPIPVASSLATPSAAFQRPASVPMAPASPSKPGMSDVSAVAPRLTGPVDELRSTTLADFRRLSKDPKEALLKLRDKIDLLADQSFDMKTKGIKAWQESEVQKLYLELLRASLEGLPVVDVIAGREAKGETTLTKAEFDAVRAFNREVRFGS